MIRIRNLGGDMGGVCRYEVGINNEPAIAEFWHDRNRGLAVCLKIASLAVEKAMSNYEAPPL